MGRPGWERLATKDDMNRVLEALHKLHAAIRADRGVFAWELREWKKIIGRKKLWQSINTKTSQPPREILR